jgi:periplasmic protein TonB
MTKDLSFAPSFVASALVHLVLLASAATLIGQRFHPNERNLISVELLEPVEEKKAAQPAREETKRDRVKTPPAQLKRESLRADAPPPATTQNEVVKANENRIAPPAAVISESTPSETGGSAAGAENRANGIVVAPGSGNAGNGSGSAVAGLRHGSGAPGLSTQMPPLRTNREAKPIQTARASYPPMALRMGMESDVALKIEVDPDGKVTKAEITKSGGAGFDEEALKAVKQSRFEPAQRDGQNVVAEFNYVYRFRLQR